MTNQTKLIHCGNHIFVYDYRKPKPVREFKFELDQGDKLRLKRLLLTNFHDYDFTFRLEVDVIDQEIISERLSKFFDKLKRRCHYTGLKYLAIMDFSSNSSITEIYCATNIEAETFFDGLDEGSAIEEDDGDFDFEEQDPDAYFSELWDGEVFTEHFSLTDLVNSFLNTYSYSSKDKLSKTFFRSRLKLPIVKSGQDAEDYIKELNLFDRPIANTDEFFDEKGGFIRFTEYIIE